MEPHNSYGSLANCAPKRWCPQMWPCTVRSSKQLPLLQQAVQPTVFTRGEAVAHSGFIATVNLKVSLHYSSTVRGSSNFTVLLLPSHRLSSSSSVPGAPEIYQQLQPAKALQAPLATELLLLSSSAALLDASSTTSYLSYLVVVVLY